jgi:RimJ/RimL family protein N-acetyltransferase
MALRCETLIDKNDWGFWAVEIPGYATEAAQDALKIGFQQLQFNEIVSFTRLLNVRSQAVMERLQMIRDPKTFLHPNLPLHHSLQEHHLYRLSNQQWQRINLVS